MHYKKVIYQKSYAFEKFQNLKHCCLKQIYKILKFKLLFIHFSNKGFKQLNKKYIIKI